MSTTTMASTPSFEVTTGRMAKLDGCALGLLSVFDGMRARVVVTGRTAGIAWESTQDVRAGQAIVAAGHWYRVRTIEAPAAGQHGRVSFDPLATPPEPGVPDDAVVLADGGTLRVNGPDIETATDMQVTRWEPDSHAPVAASAEAWPALYSREDTDAASVHRLQLAMSGRVAAGTTDLAVVGVEPESSLHPAWVLLRLGKP